MIARKQESPVLEQSHECHVVTLLHAGFLRDLLSTPADQTRREGETQLVQQTGSAQLRKKQRATLGKHRGVATVCESPEGPSHIDMIVTGFDDSDPTFLSATAGCGRGSSARNDERLRSRRRRPIQQVLRQVHASADNGQARGCGAPLPRTVIGQERMNISRPVSLRTSRPRPYKDHIAERTQYGQQRLIDRARETTRSTSPGHCTIERGDHTSPYPGTARHGVFLGEPMSQLAIAALLRTRKEALHARQSGRHPLNPSRSVWTHRSQHATAVRPASYCEHVPPTPDMPTPLETKGRRGELAGHQPRAARTRFSLESVPETE